MQKTFDFSEKPKELQPGISIDKIHDNESLVEAVKTWMESQWPNQKFYTAHQKTGQAVWDSRVTDGGQFAVSSSLRGYSEHRYLDFCLCGLGYFKKSGNANELDKWLSPALAELCEAIKRRQKEEHRNWELINISKEQAEKLAGAYTKLQNALRKTLYNSLQCNDVKPALECALTGNFQRLLTFCPLSNHANHFYDDLVRIESDFHGKTHKLWNFLATPHSKSSIEHSFKTVEELAEALEKLALDIPSLIQALPSPKRELLQGIFDGDQCFEVIKESVKAKYEADCSADTILNFRVKLKAGREFHRMALIQWLDSGALRKITESMKDVEKHIVFEDTGKKYFFPKIFNQRAIDAQADFKESNGDHQVCLT